MPPQRCTLWWWALCIHTWHRWHRCILQAFKREMRPLQRVASLLFFFFFFSGSDARHLFFSVFLYLFISSVSSCCIWDGKPFLSVTQTRWFILNARVPASASALGFITAQEWLVLWIFLVSRWCWTFRKESEWDQGRAFFFFFFFSVCVSARIEANCV